MRSGGMHRRRHAGAPGRGPARSICGSQGRRARPTKHAEPWVFGKLRYLRRGDDVCISHTASSPDGGWLWPDRLAAQGRSVSVVSAPTREAARPRGHHRGARIAQAVIVHRGARPRKRPCAAMTQAVLGQIVRARCRSTVFAQDASSTIAAQGRPCGTCSSMTMTCLWRSEASMMPARSSGSRCGPRRLTPTGLVRRGGRPRATPSWRMTPYERMQRRRRGAGSAALPRPRARHAW